MTKKEVAQLFVDGLNECLSRDEAAMSAFISRRIHCNESLQDYLQIGMKDGNGNSVVGLLGLLNGILGDNPQGVGWLSAEVYTDSQPGVVKQFALTPDSVVRR